MKTIICVNGTMGVGKTAVCKELSRLLPRCVFLDGDWCWDMHPFTVTEETKAMVLDNITHLLNNFIHCSAFEHVLFCWVMHQQSILDEVVSRLDAEGCRLHLFTLECTPAALAERLQNDIRAGIRENGILERSLSRLPLYQKMDTIHLDVSEISACQAAQQIAGLLGCNASS